MKITFENKHTGKYAEVTGVKMFTTDAECLGKKGYGVHYEDGSFNLFSYKEWILAMVLQVEGE